MGWRGSLSSWLGVRTIWREQCARTLARHAVVSPWLVARHSFMSCGWLHHGACYHHSQLFQELSLSAKYRSNRTPEFARGRVHRVQECDVRQPGLPLCCACVGGSGGGVLLGMRRGLGHTRRGAHPPTCSIACEIWCLCSRLEGWTPSRQLSVSGRLRWFLELMNDIYSTTGENGVVSCPRR